MAHLTLLVPRLLATNSSWPEGARPLRLPALEMLLARGRERDFPEVGFEAGLCSLFGLDIAAETELPAAALTALVDGVAAAPGWLRADPVHLRPDLGKLILFDSSALSLSCEEAARLIEGLQPLMAERGFELSCGEDPARWYLSLPAPARIRTHAPREAAGRHVDRFMPLGEEAQAWRALANDCQMLLHQAPVNQEREARGEPAVNSLWFWGGGTLPPSPQACWTRVWADDPLARGLAAYTGIPCEPCPENARAWYGQARGGKDLLVVLTSAGRAAADYAEPASWQSASLELERRWFAPLAGLLRHRRLAGLTLRCGAQAWTVRPRDLLRFWLRPRPLGPES